MKYITIKITESMAYNIAVAMKKTGDYGKDTPFDKLQKELEFLGKQSDFLLGVKNE